MKSSVYISLACLVLVVPAEATTINVPGEQPTIQAALNACSPDDTVLVAPDTYLENIVWPTTQGIYLQSEAGPEVTIIDGSNPSQPDTGSVILFAPGLDQSTVLEGFTITHGTGTYYPDFNSYGGGGILCDGTSPTIANNVITGNTERIDVGGGILCMFECSPVIRGNTITNNRANVTTWGVGGGVFCYIASATITDNIISENEGLWGCGVRLESSSSTVTGNEITWNTALVGDSYGGGLFLFDDSSMITGNTISNNRAKRGGGIRLAYSTSTIADNEIMDNIAEIDGGGMQSVFSSAPTIVRNDIVGNVGRGVSYFFNVDVGDDVGVVGSWDVIDHPREHGSDSRSYGYIGSNTIAGNTGGGIRCSIGSPTIEHCRIVDNIGGPGVACDGEANPEIHYNDISGHGPSTYGLFSGPGVMINAEDNFWGHASGPYHPITNPNGLGDRVSDHIDYTPWSSSSGVAEPVSQVLRGQFVLGKNRPNPFNPATEISYSVPSRTLLNLRIYDVDGRMVQTLVDGVAEAGVHTVRWDGRDAGGASLPSGIYYYRLAGDGFEITRTMALVK